MSMDPYEVDNPPTAQKQNLYTPRGSASTFRSGGSDGYNVTSHSYPDDLFSPTNSYGGNYVVFYINIGTDSKLAKTLPANEFVNDFPPRDRNDFIAQNLSKNKLIAASATSNTLAGVIGGSIALGNPGGAVKGAALANIPTVGLAVAGTLAPDATRSQKRLKTAIAMHVPNQLQIRYGTQWSEEDAAVLSMAGAGIDEIMKALDSQGKDSDVKGVGASIIANIALNKAPGGAVAGAALGLAANPKKEQVFKGVDFRTFQFDYQFFPRSADEAKNVLEIIKTFKYHMHPEFKDEYNFIYLYPSEFDIMYYQNGVENLNIHRHTSCVLTEMNVNYTPNGTFTTFPNGMPTQINVTMNFRELALLTKDKVQDGL